MIGCQESHPCTRFRPRRRYIELGALYASLPHSTGILSDYSVFEWSYPTPSTMPGQAKESLSEVPHNDYHRNCDANGNQAKNQNIFHVDTTQAICYPIGGGFPPPPLLGQLLYQEKYCDDEVDNCGGKVHQRVGLGLAAALLFPLAHWCSPPFHALIIHY